MACDQFLELLSARLDGALTEEEERELEAHLANCPDCRAVGAQLSALQGAFPELEEDAPPEGFARGVMDRIRASEVPKIIPLWKRPQFRALAGLAACLVLVAGLYRASQPVHFEKTIKMDVTARSFSQDALTQETDGAASLEEVPQIAAYAAPEATYGVTSDMQKAAPNPAEDGLEDDRLLVEGTTTLERMPEGAAELIPPETAVIPTYDRRGSIYLDLPLEVLDQIERLAQEQGIGVTAERCSAPGAEVRYNLEILQPND